MSREPRARRGSASTCQRTASSPHPERDARRLDRRRQEAIRPRLGRNSVVARSARSGWIGELYVELRETCQVETGTEGLERGAGALQLAPSAVPFALFE